MGNGQVGKGPVPRLHGRGRRATERDTSNLRQGRVEDDELTAGARGECDPVAIARGRVMSPGRQEVEPEFTRTLANAARRTQTGRELRLTLPVTPLRRIGAGPPRPATWRGRTPRSAACAAPSAWLSRKSSARRRACVAYCCLCPILPPPWGKKVGRGKGPARRPRPFRRVGYGERCVPVSRSGARVTWRRQPAFRRGAPGPCASDSLPCWRAFLTGTPAPRTWPRVPDAFHAGRNP